jgi:hypothetical protein
MGCAQTSTACEHGAPSGSFLECSRRMCRALTAIRLPCGTLWPADEGCGRRCRRVSHQKRGGGADEWCTHAANVPGRRRRFWNARFCL